MQTQGRLWLLVKLIVALVVGYGAGRLDAEDKVLVAQEAANSQCDLASRCDSAVDQAYNDVVAACENVRYGRGGSRGNGNAGR